MTTASDRQSVTSYSCVVVPQALPCLIFKTVTTVFRT